MAISDEWMDRLLQYDYVSTKKGRGQSSLLINGIGRAQSKKRPRPQDNNQVQSNMHGPSNNWSGGMAPMDMSRYSKKRKTNDHEE